jgi:short-subunit dehydrogenase
MRGNGGGRIVNVSSVAGVLPIPFQTWYSVSKAAINAFSMALANEIKPFGISVCAVMPGDMKTGFTDARKKEDDGDDVYSGRITRSVEKMERDERGGMPPEAAGKFICRVSLKRRVKPFYAIGLSYKLFCVLARILPQGLVNLILGAMYGG